jgi:hypothetical protein
MTSTRARGLGGRVEVGNQSPALRGFERLDRAVEQPMQPILALRLGRDRGDGRADLGFVQLDSQCPH